MTIHHLSGIAVIALFLFVVGTMDYEDQRAERANYCNMVQTKVWPDYKKIYSKECPNNR